MTISEKLTTIANNQEKIYSAGQQSIGFIRQVIGNPLELDYVHQAEHNINIQLKKRNLFDINKYIIQRGDFSFDTSRLIEGQWYTLTSDLPLSWFKISTAPGGYGSVQQSNISTGFTSYTFQMRRHANITSNAPQYIYIGTSMEGTAIGIDDISEIKDHNIRIETNTNDFSSYTLTSYGQNCAQPIVKTTEAQGVTFTNYADGSIVVHGTATATIYYEFATAILKPGNQYRLEGCPSGGSSTTYMVYLHNNTPPIDIQDTGAGKTFTAETEQMQALIKIGQGTVINNMWFYPFVAEAETVNNYPITADGTIETITTLSPTMHFMIRSSEIELETNYYASNDYEYHRFWDAYQQNGKRESYGQSFGYGWTNEIFKPKYDLKPISSAVQMFNASPFVGDLQAHLDSLGIVLDTSKCTSLASMFYNAKTLTRVGDIDITSASNANSIFYNCETLVEVGTFTTPDKTNFTFTNTFDKCSKLTTITFAGTINNNINLGACPLSRASILSVFTTLSTTTTGKICTFNKAAVDAAFETSAGANDGSASEEWLNMVESVRERWSIGFP